MPTTESTHISELLPAYALDCLEQDETVLVSEHLAGCASCRQELHALQMTVDQLALSAPEVTPPTALKGRLLVQVHLAPKPTPVELELTLWQRLMSLWKRAAPVWGAVAVILIVALALVNLILRQQVDDAQVGSGAMRVITLHSTDAAPDATGTLVISADGEYGTLVVDRLPTLDNAHVYQLWLIRDGRRIDGGVFNVNYEGYGSLPISSLEPLSSYPEFGITVEPAGGSPGPTGEKVLGGSL